ncbi:hypothetical protein MAR_019337 [Mya arenaria]|uniref:Maturase K n=1 Tax=Mya arenaria TaxID=6604 RepID=A0ABY7ELX1_MYAAR|nr:hypothetical protein MAR_019337 [Mya arenaria]
MYFNSDIHSSFYKTLLKIVANYLLLYVNHVDLFTRPLWNKYLEHSQFYRRTGYSFESYFFNNIMPDQSRYSNITYY